MIKIIKPLLAIVLTMLIINTSITINADTIEIKDKIYKVGFYDYNPYFYINEKGNPDGYYNELLENLSKDLHINYEYVMLELKECIENLESGEIDLLIGLNRTSEREEKFIYTDHYIAVEKYGIYTNKNIEFGHLEELENLNFGIIEKEANSEWILSFFNKKNITINPVKAKTYKEMTELLLEGKADAISSTITNKDLIKYNQIYEYSAGPVYIATSKNNLELANKINKWLKVNASEDKNTILKLHNKYFGKILNTKEIVQIRLIFLFIVVLMILILYFKIFPMVKRKIIQNKIQNKINSNQFLIHYQPIVNPKKNQIVAFEALIRLNDPKKGILSPYLFLKEIEENDMMDELSIWILNKILSDYNDIKILNDKISEDYYISMNLTTNIIENTEFIDRVKDILDKSDVKATNICIEIVETYKINNLNKIKSLIKELKSIGIKIAIDDFGVEHSNLDVLEKIDFDIMKLDKYFVDTIESSMIRIEIVKFLSNIGKVKHSCVIAEGVENEVQKKIIKNIDNDKFYIQGYYYSKPVDKKEIKDIKI